MLQEDGECNLLHNMVLLLIRQQKGSTSCSANSHINVSSMCHHLETSTRRKKMQAACTIGNAPGQIVDEYFVFLSVRLRNSWHKNENSALHSPSCHSKPE